MEILEVKTISKIWSIPTCALLGLRGRSCGEMESRTRSKESGWKTKNTWKGGKVYGRKGIENKRSNGRYETRDMRYEILDIVH